MLVIMILTNLRMGKRYQIQRKFILCYLDCQKLQLYFEFGGNFLNHDYMEDLAACRSIVGALLHVTITRLEIVYAAGL